MRHIKKRKPGVQVKKYNHGGLHTDPPYVAASDATSVVTPDLQFLPVLQALPESQAALDALDPTRGGTMTDYMGGAAAVAEQNRLFEQLAADLQRQRLLDQGEIRPLSEPSILDRFADFATMFANPLDAIKAASRYDTFFPTRDQMRVVETPMGATMQALNPVDDIAFFLTSLASDNQLEQALGPLLMFLPQVARDGMLEAQKKLRRARAIQNPAERNQEVAKVLVEMQQQSENIVRARSANPVEFDDALKEAVQEASKTGIDLSMTPLNRLSSDDIALAEISSMRQRQLGYTGRDPLDQGTTPGMSTELLGGPPITTVDPRGMTMIEGTPSERAVTQSLTHQSHGTAQGTGLIASDEMQRMAENISLQRVPVEGAKYNVIRGSDVLNIPAREIQAGDIITTLSQQAESGMRGTDRMVSFSDRDLGHLMAAFGNITGPPIPEDVIFKSPAFDALSSTQKANIKNQIDLLQYGDANAANLLSDMGYGYGVEKEVEQYLAEMGMGLSDDIQLIQKQLGEDVMDPNRPGFKITNTQGLPVLRADLYRPSRGPGSQTFFGGESEVQISAKQPFRVIRTGGVEESVPFIEIVPETGARFRYDVGGKVAKKIKVLKKEGRPHAQAVAIALSMRDRNEL
jgi:hypothetical protein|tara:strand:- start:1694 stop:3589 length:1896 start_codon:yes stop_codon:yes gene_type:complete